MVKKTLQNSPKKFHCKKCDYYANRISDFNKHLQTRKHNVKMITKTLHPKTLTIVVVEKNTNFNRVTVDTKKRVNLLLTTRIKRLIPINLTLI